MLLWSCYLSEYPSCRKTWHLIASHKCELFINKMSFASIWGFTSKMALVIIKKKNRISQPADNFQVKKGCIREACVLIPSVPEFCHTFFQHLLQLQLICQDHFLNLIQKSQYLSFNFIAIRFINKNKEPLKICLPPNLWL